MIKEKRQRGGIGRTVAAFTLGATAGSIVALLFAPASGKVTRRRIGLKIHSLQRSATRQLTQAKKVLAAKAETLRDAATERLGYARKWMVARVNGANGKHPVRQHAPHHA